MSSIRAATHTFNASGNTNISIGSNDRDLTITVNNLERVSLASNGKIGFGINVPTEALHIVSTELRTAVLLDNATESYFYAVANSGVNQKISLGTGTYSGIKQHYVWGEGLYPVNFLSDSTIRMTIANTGNIGIGTTNPGQFTLNVNGQTYTSTINSSTGNIESFSANIVNARSTIFDGKGDVRDIPINNQTASYILTISDTGKTVAITTGNVFVPNAVFSAGQAVSVYNNSAASITVTQNTSVTMYLAGTATTGNRTLAQRGVATVLCVAANTFVISGAGLS